MPQDVTKRHRFPLLYVGQAQKEFTHNEALVRLDALLHPVVEAIISSPPSSLDEQSDGLCWLIGGTPTGLWFGHAGKIARWSGGSWRYLTPVEGMTVWHAAEAVRYFYISGSWSSGDAIANPSGGSVIDQEARVAINGILAHLRQISSILA